MPTADVLIGRLLMLPLLLPLLSSDVSAAGTYTTERTRSIRRRASAGCGSSPPAKLNKRTNVTMEDSGRTYMYWLPASYDADSPTPLILSFHGASRFPDWQADLDRLTDPFFNTDHILVYPASTGSGENRTWEGAPGNNADDVADVMEILDRVEASLCVDTSRIYAAGKSQGGMMTNNLACDPQASRRIAAFAPVSGSYYVESSNSSDSNSSCDPETVAISCNPGRANVPVLAFHGGNDTTIPYLGGARKGACLPSIQHFVTAWATRDGLAPEPVEKLSLTSQAEEDVYGTGSAEGLVRFVYDGDHVNHDWPATIDNTDNLDHGSGPASFNASSMIMEFFSKYTLPDPDDDDEDGCDAPSATSNIEVTSACFATCPDFTATETPGGGMTIQTSVPTCIEDMTSTPVPSPTTSGADTPVQTGGAGQLVSGSRFGDKMVASLLSWLLAFWL
ncbi:Alpha/Beta hydrolase protein [Xylariomycetidae sp. FL2044]|nr:Alpha/Beta hydrolase protein [Xylariomycetidae sp. FL2044]